MKAVILVGGKATRLLPLTCNKPKAMMPVLNTPFLEHVIRQLKKHQIEDIILAQGHLAPPMEGYFGDGSRCGVRLYYSVEDTPLGSGGAVKNAERYLDDSFIVLNGDIFSDLDITAMIDFHRQRRARATIAVIPVEDPTSLGLVATDNQGRVTRFHEKPGWSEIAARLPKNLFGGQARSTYLINAGAWLVEHDVLARIPPRIQFSFERDLFPELVSRGEPVYAYPLSGYWMDMGTPEKYLQLHRDLLSGKSSQYVLAPGKEVLVGGGSEIHPIARLEGPIIIGSRCSIGRKVKLRGPLVIGNGCTVLENSVIESSVIWENARLGPGVRLKDAVLGDNCRLGAGSRCEMVVLSDGVTIGSNCALEPGSKIWPGETVEAT